MRPLRGVAIVGAALIVLASARPAQAGWQNVFQVTCLGCCSPSVSGYYSAYYNGYNGGCCDPCPCPCPTQVCETRYVQRCYYQPVTCYQQRTYYEAVTTYRTSYYYEPVTCYRYTCCYDPCTCSYRQVATPYTSYYLRSQCCPVTSYVQRCCYVPVTTYRRCCYWEPQTCCSLVDPCANGVRAVAPAVTETPAATAPAVPAVPAPGVREYQGGSGSPLNDRVNPPPANLPEGSGSSFRRSERPAVPPAPKPPARPPVVPKLDRIAYDSDTARPPVNLVGQVMTPDRRAPRAGARLLFVSDAPTGKQEATVADASGKFRVSLASGNWLVYVRDDQGKAVFQQRVNVQDKEVQQMTLLSR